MKYFYFLILLLGAQSILAQQRHISEVGIPVDGLENVPVAIEEQPQQMLIQNPIEEESSRIGIGGDPIVIEDLDYVGSSKGQFSVSLAGAATYNLPIEVPPGINGIVPQIGLTYSSQSQNGIVGYGWNISGLSSISKVGSNKFFDVKNSVINYSSDDRFMLDGQRLLLKSGTYGTRGAVYQTENFSNVIITGIGSAEYSNHDYFKVEYPDGTIAYYGRRYEGSIVGSSGSPTKTNTVYALTYLINPQNVVINYHYIVDNGNLLISSIRYGYRSTNPLSSIMVFNGYNSISFTYKNRNRIESGYVHNEATKLTKILDKITVRGYAENYRTYQLAYKVSSLGYEQLQKITETSGDGVLSKAPVSFSYGADPTENLLLEDPVVNLTSAEASLSQITSFNTKTIPGDYSGSGKLGYLMYHTTINDGDDVDPHIQSTKGDVLRIFDPGTSTLTSRKFTQHFNEVVSTKVLNHNDILLPNQGFTTITRNASYPVNNAFPYRFDSFIFMPQYIGQMALINTKNFNLRNYGHVRDYFISGDFNGDGLSEIIRTEHPKNYKNNDFNQYHTAFEIIDLKNNSVYGTAPIPIGFNYQVVDVDGDGYDEFIVMRHGAINIYKFNQTSNTLELSPMSISNSNIIYTENDKRPIYMGDFNGDGKLDFVVPNGNNSNNWTFFINAATYFKTITKDLGITFSHGSEEKAFSISGQFLGYWNVHEYNYLFTDINNDGKTDIVKTQDYSQVRNNTSNDFGVWSKVWVCENLNFDIAAQAINFGIKEHTLLTANRRSPIYTISNFNQKNYKSELAVITDNRLRTLKYNRNNALTQQLKTISEHDITTRIVYDSYDEKKIKIDTENPANSDSEDLVLPFVSFDDAMAVYPKVDIDVAPGLYLVKKVTYDVEKGFVINNSSVRKQLFSYADATISHNGKGFLGFKGRMVTNIYRGGPYISDLQDQVKNVTIFDLDNNSLVKEEYVAHSTDWVNFFSTPVNYLTKKVNTYNVTNLSNKVFKAQNTQSVINEGLTGIQRTINSTYDAYSNPLSVTETVTGGGETSTLNTVFTYSNSLVNDNYYIGRPFSKTVKVNNVQTSKEVYTYVNHLLTTVKKEGAVGSAEISETNEFDASGNVIKKTISSNDIQPRVASYIYDISGRYIEKATDTEGLETAYVYNKNKGWLLSQTNPYGLTSSFGYNALGMTISETDYLGNITTFAYKTNSFRGLGASFVRKEIYYPDGRKERSTVNAWGNKSSEGYTDIEGNWINTSYNYDSQDRLIKKSEPYTSTASLFTNFEYDQYGRIIKTVLPTSREVTASYNGLSSTVNDGVKTRTETKNANNQTKKVVDNGETINYVYNANGTLKNTNYAGTVIGFEYDGWGRKTKMTDPSAGTYIYEYNSIGDLLRETTPNGGISMSYDATGKIYTIGHSGKNIKYNYGSDKLPVSIITNSADGPYVEYFTYDNYKRIITKRHKTAQGFTFTYNYTYDALGRQLTEEKIVAGSNGTDSFKTKNVYKNGYLWKLQNATTNTDLKVYNSINQRGQVTNFTLANGLVTNRTYDQYGYLTQNTVNKNNVAFFTLNNTWDVQRGNLSTRNNNLFDKVVSETFQYDAFDRLTNFVTREGSPKAIVIAQETNTYDAKGRILNNNVGDYNYDSAKAYQLQNVENLNDLAHYQNNPLQQVTYDVNKAPLTIKQQGKENIYFKYDGFNNRTAMYYGNEAADETTSSKARYYSPKGDIEIDFDKVTNKYIVNMYVDGDPYMASVLQRKENNATAFYYLHRDYLGSILAITNSTGAIVEKRHFDAWGNVLLVQDGQNNNLGKLTFLERGYTGHEHLQGVGLINMNARLYDAKLHRFLAPDNFIQDPGNPQNYNLYGYVLNNPLKFTDPSGNVWHIVIGAVIGGVVNLGVKFIQGDIKSFKDGAVAFGIGAVAGGVGAATGGVAFGLAGGAAGGGGGFLAGAVGGMAGAAFSTPIQSLGNHLYFGDPIMSGKEYLIGIAAGGVLGGTVNGGIAAFNGKNFWTGSVTPKPTVQPSILASIDNGIETNNDISKLSLNIHDENIQQALPQNRGFVYKSEHYYEKVSGIDGAHNWNKTTIEIVAENGQVFENIYRGRSQTLIQFSGNRFGKEGMYELIIEGG